MTREQTELMDEHFKKIIEDGVLPGDPPFMIPCRDCGESKPGRMWPCMSCGRVVCDACWSSQRHAKQDHRAAGVMCGLLPGERRFQTQR